jgi:hypothetical protein
MNWTKEWGKVTVFTCVDDNAARSAVIGGMVPMPPPKRIAQRDAGIVASEAPRRPVIVERTFVTTSIIVNSP